MRIVAIIPAHNEAQRIESTVRAVHAVKDIDEVIVVDDGSTDDTAQRARHAGATTLRLERNAGKGAALQSGLDRVPDADIVVLLDADLADSASQAGALLVPVLDGRADMSIAGFPRPAAQAGFGLVKGLARCGIRRLGGDFDAQAPLSGQRALNRRAIETSTPFARGYGVEVSLSVLALRAGLTLVEVPTTMHHAATGRDVSGFLHRGRQFVDVARALLRLAVSH
jgi:glycosyltransferase involved in cell wall biosynthesis